MSLDQLFSEIDKRDIVALLSHLVSMPSYDSERLIVEYISRRFDGMGIEYEITEVASPDRSNLTAFAGSGERSLIFNTHTDTIPPGNLTDWRSPPLELTRDGNVLFGLGACDAKGSLASMLTAFELLALNNSLLDGRLILQAVCCEETYARGTLAEVARGISADAAIIGEPNSLVPMIGHKGGLRLAITVFGKAAHGSAPQEGVNAISRMAGVVQALDRLAEDISRRSHPLFGNASLAVTQISGGQASNVIPDSCTIALDRRLIPGETVHDALAEISAVMHKLKETDPALRFSIQKTIGIEPCSIPLDDAIVETVSESIIQVNGEKRVISGFSACCDMWCLVNGASIPTMILGPGETLAAHKANERITVDELYEAAKIYAAIALNWLGRK